MPVKSNAEGRNGGRGWKRFLWLLQDAPSSSLARGKNVLQSILDRLGINNLESHDSQTETESGMLKGGEVRSDRIVTNCGARWESHPNTTQNEFSMGLSQ